MKVFVDEAIEGKEEWLVRRKITEKNKLFGGDLILVDIRSEMGLKLNTYHKYTDFIEKLIKELNGI